MAVAKETRVHTVDVTVGSIQRLRTQHVQAEREIQDRARVDLPKVAWN